MQINAWCVFTVSLSHCCCFIGNIMAIIGEIKKNLSHYSHHLMMTFLYLRWLNIVANTCAVSLVMPPLLLLHH